jgi:hypothetical protein
VSQLAKFVADRTIDRTPELDPRRAKNPAAVAYGSVGGKMGGLARANKLSPAKRSKIARKGARARWSKKLPAGRKTSLSGLRGWLSVPASSHGKSFRFRLAGCPFLGALRGLAMLVKFYGTDNADRKFSPPPVIISEEVRVIQGSPDRSKISTSIVERQNLTMRMSMRRFTRLTNGFSKKVANHAASVNLHFMYCNFARPHKSLSKPYPRTPAMAAGIADPHLDVRGDRRAARLMSVFRSPE